MSAFDRFLDFFERHKVSIMGTIVLHFLIVTVFSFWGINNSPQERISVIKMDFTQPKERLTQKEIEEKATQDLDQQLAEASNKARNLASTSKLPSDYNKINEEQVSNNTRSSVEEEINQKLREIEQQVIAEQRASGYGYTPEEAEALINSKKQEKLENVTVQDARSEAAVSGPTNITYRLENRYDTYIYVPTYLCQYGGEVTINIVVDRNGNVASAKVDYESSSTNDNCLLNAALEAAQSARFNKSSSAPKLQPGNMTFRFIPQ
tara:strand:- start:166 stop:957 length:792 start_codon:yes stop_codon:yes gene_type:complete